MNNRPTLGSGHGREEWDWSALSASCLHEARRLLASEQDAEEAAQDALLRAWRRRADQKKPGSERWWVRQIARNEALRHRARETRNRDLCARASAQLAVSYAAARAPSVVAEILALRDAIAELAPGDALLLRLRYEGDLTQPRLARLAGMPEGTVKIRLHRIRGRLRERLTDKHE